MFASPRVGRKCEFFALGSQRSFVSKTSHIFIPFLTSDFRPKHVCTCVNNAEKAMKTRFLRSQISQITTFSDLKKRKKRRTILSRAPRGKNERTPFKKLSLALRAGRMKEYLSKNCLSRSAREGRKNTTQNFLSRSSR